MALIKCPECGKEISDRAKACIHCGYPLSSEESIISRNQNNILETDSEGDYDVLKLIHIDKKKLFKGIDKLKSNKTSRIILVFLIVLLCFTMISSNTLSDNEKEAVRIVMKYQDNLKNSDSLIIRGDISFISYNRDGKSYEYVFFNASGENSYGASVTSTPCFVNGQYVCTTKELPTTSEYMNMSDSESKLYLGIELALSTWNLYGEDATTKKEEVYESYSVNGKKVAKKLNVKYKKD